LAISEPALPIIEETPVPARISNHTGVSKKKSAISSPLALQRLAIKLQNHFLLCVYLFYFQSFPSALFDSLMDLSRFRKTENFSDYQIKPRGMIGSKKDKRHKKEMVLEFYCQALQSPMDY